VLGGEIHIKGAVVNTPSLAVHSGGSLLLSGNRNRISDSAALTLGSGRFGFAPDLNNASESLGTLTLQSDSILDFGSGSGNTLTFSSIVLGSTFLQSQTPVRLPKTDCSFQAQQPVWIRRDSRRFDSSLMQAKHSLEQLVRSSLAPKSSWFRFLNRALGWRVGFFLGWPG
jgi:hypothetical protein